MTYEESKTGVDYPRITLKQHLDLLSKISLEQYLEDTIIRLVDSIITLNHPLEAFDHIIAFYLKLVKE